MQEETLADAAAVAQRAAKIIAGAAREAVARRGRFLLATSGGSTPWLMLRRLADEAVPWAQVHLFQVDERVAPEGDPARNLTHLRASLLDHLPVQPGGVHPMPVMVADLAAGAAAYAVTLRSIAGTPAVLDLVHLGLGEDGHTASLLPSDPALEISDADVALAGPYAGHLRLTLTFPVLDRARQLLWVVTGAAKAAALGRLRRGDGTIPAARVRRGSATVLSDLAAGRDRGAP